MSRKTDPSQPFSRLGQKERKRKINKFYNIAITVVIVLIVVIGAAILTGNKSASDKAGGTESKEKSTKQETPANEQKQDESAAEDEQSESSADEDTDGESTDGEEETDEPELNEVEGTDNNVEKAYESGDWKPVGTEQSGEHVTSFDRNSADWKEMTAAMASSTGISTGDMTIWRLENGGAPDKATGTVSAKNDGKTYRVHLQWVDGEGWKTAKMEELKQNDKK